MLAQSHQSKEPLALALPSAAAAFDLEEGARGRVDPADRRLIDALTRPAHTLSLGAAAGAMGGGSGHGGSVIDSGTGGPGASLDGLATGPAATVPPTDVAGQLAAMLWPFRRGAPQWRGGARIPNYVDGDAGEKLVRAFERQRVERSRKRVEADAGGANGDGHSVAAHGAGTGPLHEADGQSWSVAATSATATAATNCTGSPSHSRQYSTRTWS